MDDYEREMRRMTRREKRLQKLGDPAPRCGLCGEDDPRLLERHHVAGRANSALEVFLCFNCHGRASDRQEDLVPDLRSEDLERDPLLRQAALLQGAAILLILLAIAFAAWAHYNVAASQHLASTVGPDWWRAIPVEVPK